MAAYNKFNSFVQRLTDKGIALNADVFKAMLTNTAPVATNTVYSNLVDLATGAGYTAGGTATTITESFATGTVTEKGSTVTFTSTGTLGPLRYVVLYDSTTNDLIAWWDYGSSITLNNTETLTVTFDASLGIFQIS